MKKNGKGSAGKLVLNGIVLLNSASWLTRSTPFKVPPICPERRLYPVMAGQGPLAKGVSSLAERSFRQASQLNPRHIELRRNLRALRVSGGDMNTLSDVANSTIAALSFSGRLSMARQRWC